jgi:hypothetical protein
VTVILIVVAITGAVFVTHGVHLLIAHHTSHKERSHV